MTLTEQQTADLLRRANDMRSDICDTCGARIGFRRVRLDAQNETVLAIGVCSCHNKTHTLVVGTFLGLGITND